jgi:glycosyltransferase involved in cell wall biosynthesis
MNFLHLAAADHGGAGIAAWRIHDALRTYGHESRMLVLDSKSRDPDVAIIPGPYSILRVIRGAIKGWLKCMTNPDYYFQDQNFTLRWSSHKLLDKVNLKPDIIIVHFISHFLNASDVRGLHEATDAPVIWSLLDMGLMTGGCHYAWHCQGYLSQCGDCPALRISSQPDLSAKILKDKSKALFGLPGVVLAASSTLAYQARASSLFGAMPIETVLLGVSPDVFRPRERNSERHKFGIYGSSKLIFFGAQRISQRRKGMGQLLAALNLLRNRWPSTLPLPSFLTAGDTSDLAEISNLGFEHHSLGFVNSETLARAYAAADLFACPSIEDSGPMMINEALMCGTPVVAFSMGVASDLIIPGITGQIAELNNPESFANCLMNILMRDETSSLLMGKSCREIALQRCTYELQVRRVIEISESAIITSNKDL